MRVIARACLLPMRDPTHLDMSRRGTYVDTRQWDRILHDPAAVVLDVRNAYETSLGSFVGAVDPQMDTFKDFERYVERDLEPALGPAAKDTPIGMFCTGGIRCELASAYLVGRGFSNVYHLKGGVLRYLEERADGDDGGGRRGTDDADDDADADADAGAGAGASASTSTTDASAVTGGSLWRGQCYVFDKRVSVGHGLVPGNAKVCYACRTVLSAQDITHESFVENVACRHCDATKAAQAGRTRGVGSTAGEAGDVSARRARERDLQMTLAKERGHKHLGR